MVLPGVHRKGNLISSLILFFIAFAEKIIAFEQDVLHSSWLLKNRFIKQGLIIAATFLFLLSSIEWTADNYPSMKTLETETGRVERIDKTVVNTRFWKLVTVELPVKTGVELYPIIFSPLCLISGDPRLFKRFLYFRVFRI